MKRSEIINILSDAIGAKTYVEIGVEGGITFNEVKIENKHGVDPDLKVETTQLTGNFSATTSDDFFYLKKQEARSSTLYLSTAFIHMSNHSEIC